ncbi:MAG TPA: EamA family transporter, partial [Stenotrophomonas sp.]|nr:EamA family transporter [Stenotrophomonas sp.]
AALLLHETVSPMMLVVTLCAVACVAGARRFVR